jgi:hypothetical protein
MANSSGAAPRLRISAILLGVAVASTLAHGAVAAQVRLVHCGAETCLRLSGHRPHAAVAVRIAGRDLAVEGNRAWHMTVPLSTARDWPGAAAGTLRLTLADARTGIETTEAAALPPGSLGTRVELATLVVRAY